MVEEKEQKPLQTERTYDPNQIMAISNQNRKFRNEEYFEYAPKEWMSANIIAVELGTTKKEVELAISKVTSEVSARKFKINSGSYLSSLGIKRTFYGQDLLDRIYMNLVGSTRKEQIKNRAFVDVQNFDELEKRSVENEERQVEPIDLEWRDYDLLPSFTLEGDSLEDEEEGVNIGDTSELHPKGEPIEGELNDLIGYRYPIQGGRMGNYRSSLKKPKIEKMLKRTERYGLYPVRGLKKDNLDFRSEIEEQEMEKIMMDIISSPDILSAREREIISMRYFNNDNEQNTYESIGERYGVSGTRINQMSKDAIKKIRKAVNTYELTGKIAGTYFETLKNPQK